MPPYSLHEVQTRAELDAIVRVIFRAQYDPYLPSSAIFFPVFGYTEEDRAAGIAAAQERLWKAHESNPGSHWIFVRDDATAKVVAGTQWEWRQGSQFKDGIVEFDCSWWPDVEARKFCEEMVRQIFTPRTIWMREPFAALNLMAVEPEHRRRGIGKLLMDWGIAKVDELGIESFIEASPLGRSLYEKWGYQTVMKLGFFIPSGKREDWNKYAHEMMIQDWFAMWRPKGGTVGEGEKSRPWQLLSPMEPRGYKEEEKRK